MSKAKPVRTISCCSSTDIQSSSAEIDWYYSKTPVTVFKCIAAWLRSEEMALRVKLFILCLSIYNHLWCYSLSLSCFQGTPKAGLKKTCPEQWSVRTVFLTCTELKGISFKLGTRHENVALHVECPRYFPVFCIYILYIYSFPVFLVQLKIFNPKFNYCCFFYKNFVTSITFFPQRASV